MVAVTRPVVDSLNDAADPMRWLASLATGLCEEDRALVEKAFHFARELYGEQRLPATGEHLFAHAVAAAAIVADLDLGAEGTVAALLFAASDFPGHDVEWVAETFSTGVAELVDGVNRMRRITEFAAVDVEEAPEERAAQAESMRKMLLAMVADIRIVLIKLAWRTQTMHFLSRSPSEALRRQVAQETLDVFAPLANRLGVWQLKWELEDLAFRHLEPENYKKIAKLLDERRIERIEYIDRVQDQLREALSGAEIEAEVAGRPKHIFSIWKKMRKKNLDFSELYDIRAVRVLVHSLKDCYAVLGLVHSMWHPIPGEFDDYISNPKANDYKSLHTAVIGPEDKAIEVQIRTFAMHKHAEFGVAAHWRYKEGGQGDAAYEEKIAWLRQLLEWRDDLSDRPSLAGAFQTALFSDVIYVLTPAGKVLALPQGSTPIDFAYSVHTNLGHRCRGAKIDGQIVPLSTPLQNGQRVEILTVKEGGPSVNWLHDGWVTSHRAISKIRQWIRQQNIGVAIDTGKQIFDKELSKLPPGLQPNLDQVTEKLGFAKLEEVFAALGHGELGLRAVTQALRSVSVPVSVSEVTPESMVRRSRGGFDSRGVLIEGINNLMTVLSKCCKPAPPDVVVGFVTKGRGISIHRANCVTLKRLSADAPERLITAQWGHQEQSIFPIDIEVIARDRSGLLRDISDVFSRERVNVIAVNTVSRDSSAKMRFTVEVRQVSDLFRVFARVMDVQGVQEVLRL